MESGGSKKTIMYISSRIMKLYVNYESLMLMIIKSAETLVLKYACLGALEVLVCCAANLQAVLHYLIILVFSFPGYLLLA